MRQFRVRFPTQGRAGGWSVGRSLIAVTVLWYAVVETIFGHNTMGLVRSGAMANLLVEHGQVFRLLSSMFVHVTFVHLLVNMISLWTLTVVERLVGSYAFITVYVLSGLVGNLLSMAFTGPTTVSAGASGAIFGLFGVMLALAFLRRLPPIVRNQLLIILAINIVLDVTNPTIDWLAHLGGMVAGMLIALWFVWGSPQAKLLRAFAHVSAVATIVALLVALFTPLSI